MISTQKAKGGTYLFRITYIFLIFFYTATIFSLSSEVAMSTDSTRPEYLFLGNETLPPMSYTKDDKRIGIVVDLANAIKKRMSHAVRIDYMNWSKAQQMVLEGEADALLQINTSEEREKIYDFSGPLLESEFSIFIPSGMEDIYDVNSLKGLQVGVEEMGLPIQILKQHPLIHIVVIPDIISGFHLLADRKIDAVVVDRWVGSFVVAENNLRGIRITGEPIEKSSSTIAVRKGNSILLDSINRALDEIRKDGTYAQILAKWEPQEIIFQTKYQYLRQKIILTAILCVLLIVTIAGIFLIIEVKKRRQSERKLFKYHHHLEDLVKEKTLELEESNHLLQDEITEHKLAKSKLKLSRDELSEAQTISKIGSWRLVFENGEESWSGSNELKKIFGYPEDKQLTMSSSLERMHPDDRQPSRMAFEEALNGTGASFWEHRIVVDGIIKWIRVQILNKRDINGKTYEMLGTCQDISDRKKAEDAIQISEERLDLAINGARIGLWDWNVQTSAVVFNERWAKIVGYTLKELSPISINTWIDLCHPDDLEKSDKLMEEHFAGKTDYYICEVRMRHKEGHWVWVIDMGKVFEWSKDGKPLRAAGTHIDITERMRAEEEREKMQKEILKARKLESIGTLAGGIAHDFNNLLYVVMGNISLAQDDLKHEIGKSANLREAEKACIKAKELTARLITFSKGGDPVKKNNSIDDLLKKTVAAALSGSKIKPEMSISDDIRQVNIDEGQIKQAVRNIVVNAKEAMDDKGQLKVSCENVYIAEEGYLTLSQGEYIKISFTDQGCGISKENLEKIFDPYFSTKAMGVDKGQGLGLTVSYSIVQKHGGLISVESEPQTGTTFSVYLPAFLIKETELQKSEEKPAVQEPVKNPAKGTGKILLMDDEKAIRKFLDKVINKLGYDVETCIEGKEVVEIYTKAMESKQPFDVAILDLTNKIGMGGQETMKRLLEIDSDAKGIIITGYSDDPVVADFRAYGFSGFIIKPATRGELSKVIKEVISKDQ